MPPLEVILYYKFVEIDDPQQIRQQILNLCSSLDIRGRILLAHEGINGSVSGTPENIAQFKSQLTLIPYFNDIVFKTEPCIEHPFDKVKVLVRDTILNIGTTLDMSRRGKHLAPHEFKQFIQTHPQAIILDTRNDYESNIGKFKNALECNTKTFREFPEFVKKIEDKKDTPIVMYCTGGIRCEKASAYMIQHGFKEVYQLQDGILNYIQQLPNTLWEGKCFVFDKRMRSQHHDSGERSITHCIHCGSKSDLYANCHNPNCDELMVICRTCQRQFNKCCSTKCQQIFLQKKPTTARSSQALDVSQ